VLFDHAHHLGLLHWRKAAANHRLATQYQLQKQWACLGDNLNTDIYIYILYIYIYIYI
jgi:hypothetical protein